MVAEIMKYCTAGAGEFSKKYTITSQVNKLSLHVYACALLMLVFAHFYPFSPMPLPLNILSVDK